jgi:glycosyltransferase involved in cell wall biosynthesis
MTKQERPVYVHVGREEPGQPERALAERLGIAGATRFAGSQPDVRAFLWAADAVAMPSLTEGLALSALEAVACGAPLVCSRIDGLTEIAAQAPSTVLVTPEPTAIAEGLRAAIAAARGLGRRHALQDSARIRELFSMSNGVNSIVQGLYV